MFISTSRPLRMSHFRNLCLLLSTLFIFFLLSHHHHRHSILPCDNSLSILHTSRPTPTTGTLTPTTLRHLLFSIAASSRSFPKRTPYLRLWYNPNSTRALVFLDRAAPDPHPSDSSLPPILISGDTSGFPYAFPGGSRSAIRIARVVKEAVDRGEAGVRWFVFGDDDTVFFAENLVRVLAKYDHERWYYVGSNSESYEQNLKNSFGMAFGGGGFAISHSLAIVLARVLDSCLMRYPHLYGSDARVFSCLTELGVGLTHEPGFHQVDIRGNLFGMLSAHPLSPLVSLHHLDAVDPIFPNSTQIQALQHLLKAVNVDPARVLQHSVCYDRSNSKTVSVSWGYSVQVFEGNYLLPDLLSLQRTFTPWKRSKDIFSSHYMFKTREYTKDPCQRPAVFFFHSISSDSNGVWTSYSRNNNVGFCSNRSAIRNLKEIRVFSHKLDLDSGGEQVPRRQCCDVLQSSNKSMVVEIRSCAIDELISMHT